LLTVKVTVVVIMVFGGSMLALVVVYNQFLKNMMTEQDRDVAQHGQPRVDSDPWVEGAGIKTTRATSCMLCFPRQAYALSTLHAYGSWTLPNAVLCLQ
jgi:hypothetical protein